MISYIIRRLFAAVMLLFIVSAATFSIFYLIPRLGGATPETLATRYVGRAATAETVRATTHTSVGSVANSRETPSRPPNHTVKTMCSRYV